MATPTTPRVHQSAQSAFKSQPLGCIVDSLVFFPPRAECHGPERARLSRRLCQHQEQEYEYSLPVPRRSRCRRHPLYPPPSPYVFSRPLRRALRKLTLSPPQPLAIRSTPVHGAADTLLPFGTNPLSRAHTCVAHACTYLPVYAESAIPILVPFLWQAVSAVIGEREREDEEEAEEDAGKCSPRSSR